ncbi:MAG: class I SAM-dependent methyltransferase [Micromonosporaceae bacterium]
MPAALAGVDRAGFYQRSRPPYAPDILKLVADRRPEGGLGVVADIGCGTGLSTAPFLGIAEHVVGVEPDAGMRAMAAERLSGTGVEIVDGSAESTGLPDSSVDLLVAASCFEWFDHRRAAREFRRVLRPTGRILLMWNHRVVIDCATYEWDRLWHRHMGPHLGPEPWDIENLMVPAFLRPTARFRRTERHRYDRTRLCQFALSSGYAPGESQPRRRQALLRAITAFHAKHAHDGDVSLVFETTATLGALPPLGAVMMGNYTASGK